jgi:hypothetical protein
MRVEEMSFIELVQTLSDLERQLDPLDLEQTMTRARIDRRLMRLLSAEASDSGEADERRSGVRVAGELAVKMAEPGEDGRAWVAKVVDLSEGGLRVALHEAIPPDVGLVDTELLGGPDERHSQARAKIVWRKDGEVGLKFVTQPDAHRRRMRALVLEILRRMPH